MPECASAQRVLDIACGLGCESIAWARQGKHVVGIDLNLSLLRAAAELARQQGVKVSYIVADATRLPFRDGCFEIANSDALFEHVPAWQQIVVETNRVLANRGLFFVRTINRHCPINPEINHLHFYPWLPEFLKKAILNWIVQNRPAWINHTKFPAVNWFTHVGLARTLRSLGFHSYEIFDLAKPESTNLVRGKFFFVIRLLKRHKLMRYVVYPLMGMVQILAVKETADGAATRLKPELPGIGRGSTISMARRLHQWLFLSNRDKSQLVP
jgi:SAM-dependent methyltransferase